MDSIRIDVEVTWVAKDLTAYTIIDVETWNYMQMNRTNENWIKRNVNVKVYVNYPQDYVTYYQLCYVMLQLRAVTLIAHPHEVVKEATFLIMFYCDYFIELSQIIDVELNMDYRYSLC